MAAAVSGAVILRQDEHSMVWCEKCERCGNVSNNTIHGSPPGPGASQTSSFTCTRCRHSQQVEIRS